MAVIHREVEGHVISLAVWDRDGRTSNSTG
jgi:hypothetical protein